jgi:hypothetical protein
MKKEKLSYISLIDIHPRPTQEEYSNGKALEFPIDTKPLIKRFNHYYLGNDGKVYKIDRYMICTKRDIAEMMLQEKEKVGFSKKNYSNDKYGLFPPTTTTHLTTLYQIRNLVLADKIDEKMRVYDALELPGDSIEIFITNEQIRNALSNIDIEVMESKTKRKNSKKPKECLLTLLEAAEYR